MKLALIYSDPSSPVGLSLARDMLSAPQNTHYTEGKREKRGGLTRQAVGVAILGSVEVLTSIIAVILLGLAAHLIQELWSCDRK